MMLHLILMFVVWGRVFAVSVPYDDWQPPVEPHHCPSGYPVYVFNVTEGTGTIEQVVNDTPVLAIAVLKSTAVQFCVSDQQSLFRWRADQP